MKWKKYSGKRQPSSGGSRIFHRVKEAYICVLEKRHSTARYHCLPSSKIQRINDRSAPAESQKSHPDGEHADCERYVKAIQETDHKHTRQSQQETYMTTAGTYKSTYLLNSRLQWWIQKFSDGKRVL